jgi:hypothetical protein
MKQFSFKQRGIRWGTNTRILSINHFDVNKKQQIQQELKKLMQSDVAVM